MKKIVSLLLTAVLLCTLLSVFAVNVSAEAQTIDGTNITWELSEDGKTLTFTGEGAMPDYWYYELESCPWHSAAETVTAVQIGSGITTIGDNAFCQFAKLTSITIPESVESIGNGAFSSCDNLTSVTIPYGVTSIGKSAFSSCDNLTSVTIPYGVTSIGDSAFSKCGLTSINIPSSVQSIDNYAFQDCTNLESFTVPSSVQSIGDCVFQYCTNLTSITFKANTPPTWQNFAVLVANKKLTFYAPAGTSNDYKSLDSWSYALKQKRVKDAYVVDDQPGKNGSIMFDKDWFPADDFAEGQTVTVTVVPAEGCQLKDGSLSVMTADGKAITSTQDETDPTKFRFEMPAAKVIVKAEFSEVEHIAGKWVVETEATCTTDGKEVQKCKYCGEAIAERTIPAGHTAGEWEITPATCTTDGNGILKCTVCDEVIEEKVIPAGHTAGEWEITPATCTTNGNEILKCTVCGEVIEEKFIPAGHTEGEWEITPATCGEDGKEILKCTVCDEVIEEKVIPATGEHSFDTTKWCYDENYHWYAPTCGCEVKGSYGGHDWEKTLTGFLRWTTKCSICKVEKDAVSGSTLSGGNLWIVIGGAVIAVGAVVAAVVVKKKKKRKGAISE